MGGVLRRIGGMVMRALPRVAMGFLTGGPMGAVMGGVSSLLGQSGGIGKMLGQFASGFKMAFGGAGGLMGKLAGGVMGNFMPGAQQPMGGVPGGLFGGGGLQRLIGNSPLGAMGGAGGAGGAGGLDGMAQGLANDLKGMEQGIANKKYDSGMSGQLQKMQDMQKMAQAFQMATQILRMKHDMAMTAIKNMRV